MELWSFGVFPTYQCVLWRLSVHEFVLQFLVNIVVKTLLLCLCLLILEVLWNLLVSPQQMVSEVDTNPIDRDTPPLQHDDDSFGADHINARINLHWIIECSVVQTDLLKTLIDFMGFRKVNTLWPEHYLVCVWFNQLWWNSMLWVKSMHWTGWRTVSCFFFSITLTFEIWISLPTDKTVQNYII